MRTEYSEGRILNSAVEIIKALKEWADTTEEPFVNHSSGIERINLWLEFLKFSGALSPDESEAVTKICVDYVQKYYDFVTGGFGWDYTTIDITEIDAKIGNIYRGYHRTV